MPPHWPYWPAVAPALPLPVAELAAGGLADDAEAVAAGACPVTVTVSVTSAGVVQVEPAAAEVLKEEA